MTTILRPAPRIEREHHETTRAKRAWLDYFAMGETRSLEKLADEYRTHTGHVPTRQVSTLKNWSRWHRWQQRIEDEDAKVLAEEETKQRKAWSVRRTKDRQDFYDLSERLRGRAREMLQFPIARTSIESVDGKTVTTINPGRWDFNTVVRMLQVAAILAEQSTGDKSIINQLTGKVTIREIIAEIPPEVIREFTEGVALVDGTEPDDQGA